MFAGHCEQLLQPSTARRAGKRLQTPSFASELLHCCLHICRFGRLPTYLVSTVAFIGATIGCVFARTAEVLVLFRALQGAGGEAAGQEVQGSMGVAAVVCAHVRQQQPGSSSSDWMLGRGCP